MAVPRNLDISRDGLALVRTRHTSRSYNQLRSRKLGGKSAECVPSTLFVLESDFRDLIVGGTLQLAESIRSTLWLPNFEDSNWAIVFAQKDSERGLI